MPSAAKYFDIEVTLQGIKPRIWRRFLLRSNSTFHELHDTIQRACGWKNSHLYSFRPVGKKKLLAVSPYFAEEGEHCPEAVDIRLDTFFTSYPHQCLYDYDFGDGWEHLIEVKSIQTLPSQSRRKLLGGARAFPPEDCGGIPGYYESLEAFRITDAELRRLGDSDEYVQEELLSRREWFGDWDPERFDFEATAKEMTRRVER